MKNNHNKFNKTMNPSGDEPPLGYWKFRERYNKMTDRKRKNFFRRAG